MYEDTDELMATFELTGLTRTAVLAAGGAGGILLTAGINCALKKWTGQPGPKGWTRTLLLAGGGFFGVVATHGIIHLIKGGQGKASLAFVEET